MIIYNVTIKVNWAIAEDWLQWMQQTHIPDVLNTGCFEKHQLIRLLETDETEGPTYAVQYYTSALSRYDNYLQNFAPKLREETVNKWGDKFIAFRSLMQVVEPL